MNDECIVCFLGLFLIIKFYYIIDNFLIGLFCLLKSGIKKMSNFRYDVKRIFHIIIDLKHVKGKMYQAVSYSVQIMHSSMVFTITCISYYTYLLTEKYISKEMISVTYS